MAIDERNLRTTHINNIIKRHRDTDDLNDEQVKAFEDTLEMMGVYDSQIDEVCDPKMTSTPADVKKAITEVEEKFGEQNFRLLREMRETNLYYKLHQTIIILDRNWMKMQRPQNSNSAISTTSKYFFLRHN